MAVRKRKKAAKPSKAKRAIGKSIQAAKKAIKGLAKRAKTAAKKSVKAVAKRASQTTKPKTKKPKTKRKAARKTAGEGDYAASRAFLKDQSGFVAKNKAKIPAMGRAAEAALEGPEGAALRDAEATAAARSRDSF